MGCNCNNENDFVNISTSNTNNILGSGNYLGSYDNCDYNPRNYPEQPLLKFLASKKPCRNIEEAREMIENKRPPLVLGQPAVVQYHDASVGDPLYRNKPIKLLFCIGAAPGEKNIMFQIAEGEGGGEIPSDLIERIIALEDKMAVIDASLVSINDRLDNHDVLLNDTIGLAESAKQDASIALEKIEQVKQNVNIVAEKAEESKQIAEDISANVSKYDSSIALAIDTADEAKSIAEDASSRTSKENIQETVQELLDDGELDVERAETADATYWLDV